jgi:hypothetical protein
MTISHHSHGVGGDLRTGFSRRTSPCATGVVGLILALQMGSAMAVSDNETKRSTDAQRLSALSAVESGHNDRAIGPRGEVSRYQILPSVWRRFGGGTNPRVPGGASVVALSVMRPRIATFTSKHHREPTESEWYLLWHCPARVDRPRPSDSAKATRFHRLLAGQDQP